MISKGDDYPLHQVPRPVRDPGTDRDAYDRYFFNGWCREPTADSAIFFAVALGLYPGRNVMDAAFGVMSGGRQHNLRASRLLGEERMDTAVGPISVDVVEPLRRLKVSVDDPQSETRAELLFDARTAPLEESPYRWGAGHLTTFDYTRMTQHGTWTGTINLASDPRVEVDERTWWGTRDRSWGTRPVGAREQGAPDGAPAFYWLWAPVQFEDTTYLFDVNERPDGSRWHSELIAAPVDRSCDPTRVERGTASYDLRFRPGSRHAGSFAMDLELASGATRIELACGPSFYMSGIGYTHPTEGHGMWLGEGFRASESFDTASADETMPWNQHVQTLVRATRDDGAQGTGILEQLVFGPHSPSGLSDLLDMHP
jgi:hypothetical protein